MLFFLGSSPNNPFALLDIVDCTSEMAKGREKDAKYIVGLLKPIILRIEQTKDPNNQKTDYRGVVDLVLFDGTSNVQNAGKLVSITYPRITVVHGAKHVVSLFFKDIFMCGARLGGSKSYAVNLILRLFLYHFLHTMSL